VADIVLDSSAVLALLNEEPGAERVEAVLDRALLSSVNLAEVVSKLVEKGATAEDVNLVIGALSCRIIDLDRADAVRTGLLRHQTRTKGLSLGDRACLAAALRHDASVLTTDRAWKDIDVGIDVEILR
jgi:ribonuclease VapC